MARPLRAGDGGRHGEMWRSAPGFVTAVALVAMVCVALPTVAAEPAAALPDRPSFALPAAASVDRAVAGLSASSGPALDTKATIPRGFVSGYLAPTLNSRLYRVGAVVGSPVFLQDDRTYAAWRSDITETARHDAERAARSAVKRFVREQLRLDRFSLPSFGVHSRSSGNPIDPSGMRESRVRFGFSGLVPTMETDLPTGNGSVVFGLRATGDVDVEYRAARPKAFSVGAGLRPLDESCWVSLRRAF